MDIVPRLIYNNTLLTFSLGRFTLSARGVSRRMMHDIFKLRYRVLPIASCEIARAAKTMPETVTALHNHKEFELLSITSGQVRITIGDIPYTVSAGDLVLVNSYALHAIEVEIGRSFFADCLSFDLSLLEEEAFSRLLEQGEYETVPLVPATHPLHGPLAALL